MGRPEEREAPYWVRIAARIIRCLPRGRYRLTSLLPRRRVSPFWMRVPKGEGGHRFICDLREAAMREVCFTGLWEPQETLLVREYLSKGGVFVDVGANWGYFTLLGAGIVGEEGRVLSIEPDPRVFEILRKNILRNGFSHVSVLPVAAWDGVSDVALLGHSEDGGNWGVSKVVASSEGRGPFFKASAAPLDEILRQEGIECV